MFRSVMVWMFGVAWTAVLGAPMFVVAVLTLGMFRHRLAGPIARAWARPILAAAGVRLEVRGAEHLEGRSPRVITLNHASYADAFVLSALAPPGMVPLAKRELMFIPIVGQAFWAVGVVFIDRKHPKRAYGSITRVSAKLSRDRLSAFIAPEGTRSPDGRLQPFKRGAFVLAQGSQVPIVPMVIHGAYDRLPRGSWRITPGTITVDLHPPRHVPREADPKVAARALHDDYAAWLAAGP